MSHETAMEKDFARASEPAMAYLDELLDRFETKEEDAVVKVLSRAKAKIFSGESPHGTCEALPVRRMTVATAFELEMGYTLTVLYRRQRVDGGR